MRPTLSQTKQHTKDVMVAKIISNWTLLDVQQPKVNSESNVWWIWGAFGRAPGTTTHSCAAALSLHTRHACFLGIVIAATSPHVSGCCLTHPVKNCSFLLYVQGALTLQKQRPFYRMWRLLTDSYSHSMHAIPKWVDIWMVLVECLILKIATLVRDSRTPL